MTIPREVEICKRSRKLQKYTTWQRESLRRKDAIHSLRHLEWFRRSWRGATDCFGRWRGRSGTGRAIRTFRRYWLVPAERERRHFFPASAMSPDRMGASAGLAGRMGVSNGYASTYKRRLLGQGVIGERPGGLLDFDIPLMRAYLSEFAQD